MASKVFPFLAVKVRADKVGKKVRKTQIMTETIEGIASGFVFIVLNQQYVSIPFYGIHASEEESFLNI